MTHICSVDLHLLVDLPFCIIITLILFALQSHFLFLVHVSVLYCLRNFVFLDEMSCLSVLADTGDDMDATDLFQVQCDTQKHAHKHHKNLAASRCSLSYSVCLFASL